MKRYIKLIVIMVFAFLFTKVEHVSAKELVNRTSIEEITTGDSIGIIEIYDNSEISIGYKYGLRKVNLYYCLKGKDCDMNMYTHISVLESSEEKTYKNTSNGIEVFRYKPSLENDKEYRIRVEAYFGSSTRYTGLESIDMVFGLRKLELDTQSFYVEGSEGNTIGNEDINTFMEKVKEIINNIVLPIVYVVTGLFLIVKGALLGTQIVKSADDPQVRAEKVGALKWLVIGVAITFAASTLVGVLTGFFSSLL